jgi:hypothetical protein
MITSSNHIFVPISGESCLESLKRDTETLSLMMLKHTMREKKVGAITALLASVLILSSIAASQQLLQPISNTAAYAQEPSAVDVQVTEPSPDLTAEWWQWALSFPVDENPLLDTTGEDCSKGDVSDDIFFLAGTAGGRAERECTISEGQAILIPIVNVVNIKTLEDETEESLLAQAEEILAQQRNLKLIIDGEQIRDLESYLVTNPTFFTVELPEDNIFGISAGSYEAVAVGYWVLIEGLSAGEHTITVDGKMHGQTSFGKVDFRSQATYHLTVE